MSEQDKADRKVTIERNKQWASASTVRRDWLRAFVARKSAPVGAERFFATCLFSTDHTIRQALEAGWPLLRELLDHGSTTGEVYGAGREQLEVIIEQVAAAAPKRITMLCAWETKTGTHTWRQQSAETARYLGQMQVWGYELADIEVHAMGVDPVP
jgi:ParB family chromosome partitioning protein